MEKSRERVKEKITGLYILLMVTVYPLFTGFSGYVLLGSKKFFMFFALTSALLLCQVCFVRLSLADIKTNSDPKALILIIIFLAASAVSTIFSDQPRFLSWNTQRYDGLLTYILYALAVVMVMCFGRADRQTGRLAAAAYMICCVIALLQLADLNPFHLFPASLTYHDPFIQENGKMLGTFGNIDVMSAYHCIMIPLCFSLSAREKGCFRLLMAAAALLGLAAAILTGVASAAVALAACAVIFSVIYAGRRMFNKRRLLLTLAMMIFAFFLAAGLVYIIPFESGPLGELHLILHGNADPSMGSHRLQIWKYCFGIFEEHPVFGIGPGNLVYHSGLEYSRYSESAAMIVGGLVDNAHNEYIQLLVDFGLAGAIPVFLLAAWALFKGFKENDEKSRILAPSLVCYMIHAFFDLGLCFVTPVFCVLTGLILVRHREAQDVE